MKARAAVPGSNVSAAAPPRGQLVRRACSCGSKASAGGECAECRGRRAGLVRRSEAGDAVGRRVPPIVADVLGAPGRPLDAATRVDLSARFGHDFARVRVHADARAAESARAVNAAAYTVGDDVVFGAGRYQPGTAEGRRLIAHELAHVVQNRGEPAPDLRRLALDGPVADGFEREAARAAERVDGTGPIAVTAGGAAPSLRREVLTTEPAGGCGVCYGPRDAGSVAHALIQEEFEILHPFMMRNFPVQVTSRVNKLPDLVLPTPAGMKIGEIKPANPDGYAAGSAKMNLYLTLFREAYPNSVIEPLDVPLPGAVTVFPNPQAPACYQELYVNPPVEGVYGYYCEPPFSQLVGRPGCRCAPEKRVPVTSPQKQTEPKREDDRDRTRRVEPGVPTPAPAPATRSPAQEVAAFIRDLIRSGEDVEQAARRFLAGHPQLVNFLIGAAVTAALATIVEDIATAGVGLLDDPAILAICYRVIAVARSVAAATAAVAPPAAALGQ